MGLPSLSGVKKYMSKPATTITRDKGRYSVNANPPKTLMRNKNEDTGNAAVPAMLHDVALSLCWIMSDIRLTPKIETKNPEYQAIAYVQLSSMLRFSLPNKQMKPSLALAVMLEKGMST